MTPPFLGAIAWEMLAAPNSGLFNVAWRWATGAEEYEYLLDIYTITGLVFAISLYTYPYVFTLMVNALERVPADLEDASAMLGGGLWTTLPASRCRWCCRRCSPACWSPWCRL